MSDDKGYPLPDPVTGYPLICVTLKIPDVLQYRQDFIGHMWQLGKWWNWEQSGLPGDDRAARAAAYWRELLFEHMKIGDCPVDCCDDILAAIGALQTQANDQAALNLTRDVTNQQIQSQGLRDVLEGRYDGTPTSINPNAPTSDFGSSGDRFDALCAGLMAFVYGFARAQADSARAGQVTGLLAVALIAGLLIPGLNFFFIVGASIFVALGMGTIGVSLEVAIQALTDKDALNNVVCFMRDTLKAQGVNEANWVACLDSYPFGVGSHEAIVCDFIKPTLQKNYLTILNILGEAYTGTINGDVLPECPCAPPIVGEMVIYTAASPLATLEFISKSGAQETFRVTTQVLPNSYWYASIRRSIAGSWRVDSVTMEQGTFFQWYSYNGDQGPFHAIEGVIYPTGAALDIYCAPGTQAVYVMTVTLL